MKHNSICGKNTSWKLWEDWKRHTYLSAGCKIYCDKRYIAGFQKIKVLHLHIEKIILIYYLLIYTFSYKVGILNKKCDVLWPYDPLPNVTHFINYLYTFST